MIEDMESNKKLSLKITELFLIGIKINISFIFMYIKILFQSA